MRGMKKFLLVVLVLLGIFGLARVYFRLTDDFRLANITYEMPYQQRWEVPEMDEEQAKQFDAILDQEFRYVGKGAQSYAFKSADDRYILKFFKFKHLKPSLFVDLIPPVGFLKEYKAKQIERKERLLNSVFDGYRLAYDVHAVETGLIYIHLNKSHDLHKTVKLIDKIGMEKTVNLDDIPFILQEKVVTTRNVMNRLMSDGDVAAAKKKIGQIFDLYLLEYSKGIYDRDHGVMHNTGFIGDRAIHLDVGKLTKDDRMKDPANHQPDLQLIVRKFNIWTKAHYPQYYQEIKSYMNEEMDNFFAEKADGTHP